MNNSLAIGKKALVITVAAATILWTLGLTAFAPAQVSAASFGDLIKGETLGTVYYYGSDGMRYSFPNEKTFFSWYENFDGVVTMSDDDLADIALGGNIVYRSGTRWVKITSDNKTYAVSADGSLHWIESEEVAVGLAGDNWNTFIDDVPDVLFSIDYTIGDSLSDASSGYEGMLWSDGTHNYLITGGESKMVSEAGMSANNYQSGSVLSGSGVMLSGLVSGSNIESEMSNLTDTAQMVETETYTASSEVSVMLEAMPATTTLIAGQALADMARLTISNSSNADASLTGLTLSRTGVSSDTTLSNIYLYSGAVRLTDAATVSNSQVKINDSSGIVSVPAGGSVSLSVRSDIAAATNGQTIGVSLAAAADVTFSGNVSATGSFPMSGAIHTIAATPATFGAVSFAGGATPALATIDPQDGYRVWEDTITVTNNELDLHSMRFRNVGSINDSDIQNWKFYISGVMYGSAVTQEDADGYVTFDFSDSPVRINTGNHTVKVLADIIGGSGRTVQASLRNAADMMFIDTDYNQPVLATTFTAVTAGVQTIGNGAVTFTSSLTAPSGDVVDGATQVVIGKWDVVATGEKMRIEDLDFNFAHDDAGDTDLALANAAVFVDGVQVGGTKSLCHDDTTTASLCDDVSGGGNSYTTYTFGSAFEVTPGTTRVMELRADMVDASGTDEVANADTIVATIDADSLNNNVLGIVSGLYSTSPGADVTGNTLTVNVGTLSSAENTSYADQTTIDPNTAYKIGSFTVSASDTEAVNITEFSIDLDNSVAVTVADDLSSLYLKYGSGDNWTTASTKVTVAATANAWSVNHQLAANGSMTVDVYATLDASLDATDTIQADLTITGTTEDSGVAANAAEVTGQTITIGAGAFDEFNDDNPVSSAVAGNQEVEIARYRFNSTNETYTIKELKTSVADATAAGLINQVRLYDGSTELASTTYDEDANAGATFTGLSIPVPANSSKILTIKYLLNNVGIGAGTSQTDVENTLTSVTIADSFGVETTEADGAAFNGVDSNEMYVFKSIPTFTHVDLTNSTLLNDQATDFYKFTVSADSNGSVALKQFNLDLNWNDGQSLDVMEIQNMKLYKNGADVTTLVTIVDNLGANAEDADNDIVEASTDLYFTWATEDTIGAGETVTYTVRGEVSGFRLTGGDTVGDSISFTLATDAATNGTSLFLNDADDANAAGGLENIMQLFTSAAADTSAGSLHNVIWSDVTAVGHVSTANLTSTGDWHNGYLLENLTLSSETWTK